MILISILYLFVASLVWGRLRQAYRAKSATPSMTDAFPEMVMFVVALLWLPFFFTMGAIYTIEMTQD